ncbi:YlaH-like family protein [Geomicrobium halophilum]|nr:YlaH-like family protein [Geomicrobium halophilum]
MTLGFWLLYAAVVVLSIMVFNLGFARKLPLLKNVVVYAALLLGCFVLTFFAIFMPVVESLLAVAVVLSIYRVRLKLHKRNEAKKA